MALTKTIEIDKIEIVTEYRHVQLRTATIIKEDGVEISRSLHRHTIAPDIEAKYLEKESADVKAMVAQFHTDAVKTAYAEHLKNIAV